MCGRIALFEEPENLARLFGAGIDRDVVDQWRPNYNVGPTQQILGVSEHGGHRTVHAYQWGLVPNWADDPKKVRGTFNARAETVASKPSFRTAFRQHRVLVPVDAFYEWHTTAPKVKQPYAFVRADGDPVVMAGLRDRWRGADGVELWTLAIITTGAGPDMPIHDRQPVVLERGSWAEWLDPGNHDREELESLLVPTVGGTLVRHPVRKDVGDVRNDSPELMEAIALQGDLGLNSL